MFRIYVKSTRMAMDTTGRLCARLSLATEHSRSAVSKPGEDGDRCGIGEPKSRARDTHAAAVFGWKTLYPRGLESSARLSDPSVRLPAPQPKIVPCAAATPSSPSP